MAGAGLIAVFFALTMALGMVGTAAAAPPVRTGAVLLGPFPFACQMTDEGAEAWVYCWQGPEGKTRHVRLGADGEVSRTATEPLPTGIGGPGFPNGAWLVTGRFRCEVLREGFECVLISSGSGFLITRTAITEVQTTPGVTNPPPTFGKSAAVETASGSVLVKEPDSKYTMPLDAAARIPMGSILDTTHGTVKLSTADPSGAIQTGLFKGGRFKIAQPTGKAGAKLPEGLAVLTLVGSASPGCGAAASRTLAAARRSGGGTGSKLWGNARGNFQTGGRFATVTVRGTKWLTEDTCHATRVKVARGTVQVEDLVTHKTVTVTAGHSYVATTAPEKPKNKVPVLGKHNFRTHGLGQPHPRNISFGGDALSVVENINWSSWGSPRAVGHGVAWYLPPGTKSVSEGRSEPTTAVAFDLGVCGGKLAYLKFEWFFPTHGGHFSPNRADDVC